LELWLYLRLEILRLLLDPNTWVNDRNDGQWDSGNRQVRAARAPSELTPDGQEVVILNVSPCALSLYITHHKQIFLTERPFHTSLISMSGRVIR
jgi:hypothetical protein